MLKKISLLALAAVSMSAFAQSSTTTTTTITQEPARSSNSDMGLHTRDHWDMKKSVMWRANQALSGGDRYYFSSMLDRLPTSVEMALVAGLSNAHRQAVIINDNMLAMRFPVDSSVTTTSTTDASGTTTTTTTTTTDWQMASTTTGTDWNERSFRPMRLIMSGSAKPKDINYGEALDILTADVNDSSTAMLRDWWNNKASDRDRDVIVRLLKDDASMADQIYYPSVYTRRTWSWTTNNG